MDWRAKREQLQGQADSETAWQEHMNLAITCLEEHLCQADVERAAQIACCSSYHFQRIFSFLAGVSLAQYLRRRKLTQAAFALQEGRPVLEAALEYGYESPEAFALIGVHTRISTENGRQATAVPAFWRQCREDGAMDRIRKAAGIPENTPLHAATYHCTDDGYDYLIGTHWEGTDTPGEFTVLTVPAATWAVFPTAELSMAEAQREIARLWGRIFTEWFPTSGYELAQAPELELHFRLGDDLFRNEIWIPVKKAWEIPRT